MISEFQAPIPGESLTSAPGSRPWERPPEISDPEEAIQMHLLRLAKKDMMKDVIDALELGIDVVTLTEGILRSAVAEGIHSVDVSLIAGPVIHEYIKSLGDRAGVDYEEGLVDKREEAAKNKAITVAKAKKMVDKFRKENKVAMPSSSTPMEEETPEPEMPAMEEPMAAPEGFMKRRGEV